MATTDEFNGIKTNADLRDVSFIFRNLFKAGSLPASEILLQVGNMLPKYKSILHAGSKQISSKGWSLSQALGGLFPPETMPAIKAGEESGRLAQVFEQIWKTAKTQEEINKVLRGLIMPVALFGVGIIVALGFYLFLVPSQYANLAKGAPPSYVPPAAITLSLDLNHWIMGNLEASIGITLAAIAGFAMLLSRESVQKAATDALVRVLIRFKALGESYAHLKFGIMAQYLQIVSLAGLDADKRIDLVLDVLPEPLRPALLRFRSEMIIQGLAAASTPDGKPEDDPRHSTIFWPVYVRLAFRQAEEGAWDEPMREFGEVMLEDGKETITRHIKTLQMIAMALVGVLVVMPVSLLYGTLGEVLAMRMRSL